MKHTKKRNEAHICGWSNSENIWLYCRWSKWVSMLVVFGSHGSHYEESKK